MLILGVAVSRNENSIVGCCKDTSLLVQLLYRLAHTQQLPVRS